MRDLIPLSTYEAADRASTPRTALVMALLWGIPMTDYLVYARGNLGLGTVVTLGVIGALLFGVGWAVWMRSGLVKMVRRLFAADPSLVPPAPTNGYHTRLLASLMNGQLAVGGHLYVGPTSAQFVPHTKNLKRHQSRTSLEFNDPPAVTVFEREANLFQRLFRPGPIRLLQIESRGQAMTLLVPTPDDAVEDLRRCWG